MKSYELFKETVKERLKYVLPAEFRKGTIRIDHVEKVGEVYESIGVKLEHVPAMVRVNLSDCYRKYQQGETIASIVEMIKDVIVENTHMQLPDWLTDYAKVKDKLFMRVRNHNNDDRTLEKYPHQRMCDLVMTYQIEISNHGGQLNSAVVTKEMVKKFGVSLEQFEKDAMNSCQKNYPARIRDDYFHSEENHPKVVMITNDQFLNGAAVLFYPETIPGLLEIFPEGFILIPASIHELMAYSLTSRKDYEEIDKTIARCNTKYCDNETSVLSTHAYVYDPEMNHLETSEEYCRRKEIPYDPKTYEREKMKCENEVDEEEW